MFSIFTIFGSLLFSVTVLSNVENGSSVVEMLRAEYKIVSLSAPKMMASSNRIAATTKIDNFELKSVVLNHCSRGCKCSPRVCQELPEKSNSAAFGIKSFIQLRNLLKVGNTMVD